MKMKKYKFLNVFVLAIIIAFTSCVQDLDTIPLDKDVVTSEDVYSKPENYKNVLAKLYAGLAVSGQQGPAGMNDLSGLDKGFGQYLRAYWYAQQLPTDEAIIAWNDGNLRDYHDMDWSSNNEFISNMYYRVFYQISLTNEFIRETSPAKLDERGIEGDIRSDIELFRSEARFLRALSYWHAIDMFANVPFVTEGDKVGSFFPEQISRADLFIYIEKELLEIESQLTTAGQAEYGRADQAAVWMLLAKLYLNAEVYINQDYNSECLTYCNKIINAGYSLDSEYQHLFLADNHSSPEIIFPITQDGLRTKTWGGTTFIIHAAVGGSMDPAEFGIDSGWGGLRVTKQFVGKFLNLETLKSAPIPFKSVVEYPVIYFPGGYQVTSGYSDNDWAPDEAPTLASVNSDNNYEGYIYFAADNSEYKFTEGPNPDVNWVDDGADSRAMFYTGGQTLEIEEIFEFTYGYTLTKWKNVTSGGQTGSDLTHTDTDFPMFRLADVYLMYAEAALRGAEDGDMGTAVNYVNMVRERAYGGQGGNITADDLTLDFILDERAREFYWEAQRRTDLVRFGKFSGGDYLWAWKGAVQEGKATDPKFDIYPIPASDVIANPNLVQNPNY